MSFLLYDVDNEQSHYKHSARKTRACTIDALDGELKAAIRAHGTRFGLEAVDLRRGEWRRGTTSKIRRGGGDTFARLLNDSLKEL